MKQWNFLGYDFGASNGRAMLGTFDGEKIELKEIHRFPNDPVEIAGRFVWDVQRLFFEMKQALVKIGKAGIHLDAIGIDTWGVDFGLLDKNGNLVSVPVHYRDARTDGMMEKCFQILPKEKIFEATGLAFMQFNTLYQLMSMKMADDPALKIADKLLFMPDLLAYFLTGKAATEYTDASTSQLVDPRTRNWSDAIFEAFDLPKNIMTEIQPAGTVRGTLLPEIARECGVEEIPVIAVGSHDTASAVAAVPAQDADFAYISSGTWSLLGAEITTPLCDKAVMDANYTNEGGVCGTIRLLKNIMGLWIIQECKREWDRRGDILSFPQLVELASQAPAFKAVIDVDDQRFYAPGDMPERIREYCRETNQPVPETIGEISRVVYEGLALKYRWAIERMEQDMLKKPVKVLHIVGGGSKNAMLNQFTANALGRPVLAGPGEGTVIGNLLMQGMALGAVSDLWQLRKVVEKSFPTDRFLPENTDQWDAAYARFLTLMR
ncbi:MAG: rhamnulokinase [Eubacteriales bacterium]|nr:rhamnulokinase [Eubacteriales bacterium]